MNNQNRIKPIKLFSNGAKFEFSTNFIEQFYEMAPEEITQDFLEKNNARGLCFFMTPYALCYYLPYFMTIGLKNSNCFLNDEILSLLDLSEKIEFWPEESLDLLNNLSRKELLTLENWIFQISETDYEPRYNNIYDRAINAVEIILKRRE